VWVAAVQVNDLDRAIAFYRDLLGFPVRLEAKRFGWIELGPPEPLCKIGLSLVRGTPPDRREPHPTGIVLDVDDMDAFVKRLKAAHVHITREPTRSPWGGLVADFLDPDGNELEVVYDPDHYHRDELS